MVLDPLLRQAIPEALRTFVDRRAGDRHIRSCRCATRSPGPAFSNLLVVDGFATFFRVLVLVIGILTVLASYRYLDARKSRDGRISCADSLLGRRPVRDGGGQRSHDGLHRAGDFLDRHLRAGRLSARRQAQQRSRPEIFPAGLVRHRFLLYGIAMVYGVTASTQLDKIREALATPGNVRRSVWSVWRRR